MHKRKVHYTKNNCIRTLRSKRFNDVDDQFLCYLEANVSNHKYLIQEESCGPPFGYQVDSSEKISGSVGLSSI
ncbi:hypothetical protein HZS_2368 [Henneguya salminicola]|nr:hypothetical protein HZS_2368 [Henneguya salminicola]